MPESNRGWTATIITIFPEMFPGPLGLSLAGQALERKLWHLDTIDIRRFARDKHATVDDTPFGGGPGMVMRPDVVDEAIASALSQAPDDTLIFLTPRGRPFTQAMARSFAARPGVILLCGRYEGIDERVIEERRPREVSLGDFILSGGEPAALVIIDACIRLLPGVVGDLRSLEEESFEHDLLEYPHYTRPRIWRDREVPGVLLSGHHSQIETWRRREAERMTRQRRPDLWIQHETGRAAR